MSEGIIEMILLAIIRLTSMRRLKRGQRILKMCGLCAAWSESHLAGKIDPTSPKVSNYTQIKVCLVNNSIFALEYSVIRK
jgi:hypothetical protein